jgi:hypothetical protein
MLETILRRTALICALLILLRALGDAGTWALLVSDGLGANDGALSSLAGLLSALIAVIALVVACRSRPRLDIPLLCLLVTVAAFGLSLYASSVGPWMQLQGKIWVSSGNTLPGDLARQLVVRPMFVSYMFTLVALLGVLATSGLGLVWLRGARLAQGRGV